MQGKTLAEILWESGPISERELILFMLGAAEGLLHLHSHNIVYQIIAPEAVVLSSDGKYASLGWPSFCQPAGTPVHNTDGQSRRLLVPAYAPPEILPPAILTAPQTTFDATVDIYSLGATYCCTALGRDEFFRLREQDQDFNPKTLLMTLLTAPTASLIAKMMDRQPMFRPTAHEVVEQLRRIRNALQVTV